jgi:hypothetical protein
MGRGRDHRGGRPRALLHRPARRADATVSVEDPAPLARARPVGLGVGRHRAAGGVPGGAPGRPGAGEAGRAVCAVRLRRVVQRQVRLHGGRTLVIPVSPSANTSPETTCSSSSSPALRRQTASPFSTRRKSALKTTTLANSSSECCACRARMNTSFISWVVRPRSGRSSRMPAAALAIVVSPWCASGSDCTYRDAGGGENGCHASPGPLVPARSCR